MSREQYGQNKMRKGHALTPKSFGVTCQRQGGQAIAIATVFFLMISLSVVVGVAAPILRDIKIGRTLERSKDTYFLAEALMEDIVYRLDNGLQVASTETLAVGTNTATATVSDIFGGKLITSSGQVGNAIRRVETELIFGTGVAFNFGVQSGEGGMNMSNTSSVDGNVFSNGPITGVGNIIKGDVISAGPTGLIDDIHATGTAFSHTIKDSTIELDAYFFATSTLINTTVLGEKFSESPDQATTSLPISDAQVDGWKAEALAVGTYTGPCPYVIDNVMTIGPIKIPCDFEIRKSTADVTIAGTIWVEGNFLTDVGKPTIRIDSSLGASSVVIVVDNPSDRTTGSKIELRNGATFVNSGTEGSYILLVSQNNSAENSGIEVAIDITQSAEGDFLVYAGHGEISIGQSAELREVTAYRINLLNSAEVEYETGLANLLFTAGPGGGFEIQSWGEVE